MSAKRWVRTRANRAFASGDWWENGYSSGADEVVVMPSEDLLALLKGVVNDVKIHGYNSPTTDQVRTLLASLTDETRGR